MNKILKVGLYTIETSKVKCFVHHHSKGCAARFCKTNGEVMDNSKRPVRIILPTNWNRWVEKVKSIHGIDVPDFMKPSWRF